MANLPAGYNPPGVFTQTTIDYAQPIVAGSNNTVALIGVADETQTVTSIEVVRGSSATYDNPLYGADVSNQATGTNFTFSLATAKLPYPVVTGTGQGLVSNNPQTITVY